MLTGYALFDVAGGRIYQAWRGRELDRTLDSLPPLPSAPSVSYQPGSAFGRLEIPRLGLSVVVLEGSDSGTLRLGVGRLRNSGMPGDAGNVVLAGHRDTFFRSLREIRPGDRISLRTPQGVFRYTVDWTTVVNPNDTGVLSSTGSPALTLVTCYPFYYVGSAPQRFIVRALPVGAAMASARPSPFGGPTRPAPAVMKADVVPVAPAAELLPAPAVVKADLAPAAPDPPPQPRKGVFARLLKAPKALVHKLTGASKKSAATQANAPAN